MFSPFKFLYLCLFLVKLLFGLIVCCYLVIKSLLSVLLTLCYCYSLESCWILCYSLCRSVCSFWQFVFCPQEIFPLYIWGSSREKGHNVRVADFKIITFKVHDVKTDRIRRLRHVSIGISCLVGARLASGFHI